MFKGLVCVVLSLFLFGYVAQKQEDYLATDELDNQAEIGSAYNKLSNNFLPSCFTNIQTQSPNEIEETLVSFQNDLDEEHLRNILDLEFSFSIPIQGMVTLKPKFVFSRDAASTTLSHTSTYIAYANLGNKKLLPYAQNRLVLKPQFRRYFDANGNLVNAYEFIRLCGDEIINSQKLGSKLLITTKISFQSKKDKLYFEGDMGVSPSIVSNWVFNGKISDLDIRVRKRLRVNFYAIQVGGQPERLIGALNSRTCTLDNIEACQAILDRLHDYASNDYSKQLVATNLDRWNIETIESLPYYLSDLYDIDGQKLSFDMISTPDILDKLDLIKLEGQKRTLIEQQNFQIANMMKETKYLGTDEIATLNEIIKYSSENIQRLQLFGNECYKELYQCINTDIDEIFSKLIWPYDTTLLGSNLGELISKVYANTKANNFFDTRVSENFVALQPQLRENVYSSYYVKFKDLKNNVIKNFYATVEIKCDNFFWYTPTLISKAFQYYEILHPQMEINYASKCNDSNPLFVASPQGIAEFVAPDTRFIVELWGRK